MRISIESGIRLFVDIDGSGLAQEGNATIEKPSLVLLHGGPGYDHFGFKPAFSQLTDLVQIVYFDHRGHGRSDARPMNEMTLDTFADVVVQLCATLGITRPIVLGQSFGGFVAQRYIERYPEHPSKVILSSTSASLSLARKLVMFERLGGPLARDIAERFWVSPNESTLQDYQRVCKPLYSVVKQAIGAIKRPGILNREILLSWASSEQQTMNLLPGLSSAQCPVLVLAGELDPVCPVDDSRDIVAALPSHLVQFSVFSGCGHGVWRDNPNAAFARIRQFIVEQ
jgi:proline iminopeptidase